MWHTTKGDSLAGALAAYEATRNYPHFTLDEATTEQKCALNVGATAFMHPPGTPEANRASAIQIEIVGQAARSGLFSTTLFGRLRDLCVWIAATTGAQLAPVRFEAYPASAGLNNGVRFSYAEWTSFIEQQKRHWMENFKPMLEHAFYDRYELYPAGTEALEHINDWLHELPEIVISGEWFAGRIRHNFEFARNHFAGSNLEVARPPQGR